MSNPEGWEIALRLIAEEAEAKTGTLDLTNLSLSEIPNEINQLSHLSMLHLGGSSGEYNSEKKLFESPHVTVS